MKTEIINNIIYLRAAVSYLGEKRSWWNSNFHDSSSEDFLKYIFPKSSNTQFLCSCIATRDSIDNEVGANFYHLFRLPMSVEELINNKAKSIGINSYKSEEEALKTLKEKAINLSSDGKGGPKNIGSIDQINEDLIQVFSVEYLTAFQNDYKVHPYLN
tara:strand:- start:370 stop:843 length:474 start_codon:yes stop_codon:yes gene_type:complete